jgi:hypothetical protein
LGEGWGGDLTNHAGVFHDGDGVAHLAVGEVVAGAVGVPVLLPGGPLPALELADLFGWERVGGVMQLLVDGFPLLPGLVFGLGDVVGQLGPVEVEGQPLLLGAGVPGGWRDRGWIGCWPSDGLRP